MAQTYSSAGGGSVSDDKRRQRVLSEGQSVLSEGKAIVADSTSDDTMSSDAASGSAPNTTHNGICDEDQQFLGKLPKTLIRFFKRLKIEKLALLPTTYAI